MRKLNINNFHSAMILDYLEGSFDEDELKELEGILDSSQLSLTINQHEPIHLNAIEELFPQVRMFLSHDIVTTIISGLATSSLYDTLKASLSFIYHRMRAKPFYMISANKKIQEEIPNCQLIIGDAKVILPMKLDNEDFNKYVVDRFFESVDKKALSANCYIRYNENTRLFECLSERQITERHFDEFRKKQDKLKI